jgi:hypothetical protein
MRWYMWVELLPMVAVALVSYHRHIGMLPTWCLAHTPSAESNKSTLGSDYQWAGAGSDGDLTANHPCTAMCEDQRIPLRLLDW